MLTCINPDVSFSTDGIRINGLAVALKWLNGLVAQSGNNPPTEQRVKSEIVTLGIGFTKGKSQHFNKHPNANRICRGPTCVETVSRTCILVKHAALNPDCWALFAKGIV